MPLYVYAKCLAKTCFPAGTSPPPPGEKQGYSWNTVGLMRPTGNSASPPWIYPNLACGYFPSRASPREQESGPSGLLHHLDNLPFVCRHHHDNQTCGSLCSASIWHLPGALGACCECLQAPRQQESCITAVPESSRHTQTTVA